MLEIYGLIEGPAESMRTNVLHPYNLPGVCEADDQVFLTECMDCGGQYHHCDYCMSDLPCAHEGGCNTESCSSSWNLRTMRGVSCETEQCDYIEGP